MASGDGSTGLRGLPAAGSQPDIRILDAAFSPDARALATANSDGTISLYSGVAAASEAGDGQTGPVRHRLLKGHS